MSAPHPPVEPTVVDPAPATINAINPEYVEVPYDPAWCWPVRLKSQRWHPRGSTRRKDRIRARRLAQLRAKREFLQEIRQYAREAWDRIYRENEVAVAGVDAWYSDRSVDRVVEI